MLGVQFQRLRNPIFCGIYYWYDWKDPTTLRDIFQEMHTFILKTWSCPDDSRHWRFSGILTECIRYSVEGSSLCLIINNKHERSLIREYLYCFNNVYVSSLKQIFGRFIIEAISLVLEVSSSKAWQRNYWVFGLCPSSGL
jgi:hypothetical protein